MSDRFDWPVGTSVEEALARVEARATRLVLRERLTRVAMAALAVVAVVGLVVSIDQRDGSRVRIEPVEPDGYRPHPDPGTSAGAPAERRPSTGGLAPADGSARHDVTTTSTPSNLAPLAPKVPRLAYEANGIFIFDETSGETNEVPTEVFAYELDWSPDGRRFVYRNGMGTALVPCTQGSQCVADHQIEVVDIDGSNRRQLTRLPRPTRRPRWSPDGSRIAFAVMREGSSEDSFEAKDHDVWVMDADGSDARRVWEKAGDPSWSPDGRTLAMSCETGICVLDASWTSVITVTDHPYYRMGAWSPDGSRLAAYLGGGTVSVPGLNALVVLRYDGRNTTVERQLTGQGFVYDVSWAPNSRTLAFIYESELACLSYCELPYGGAWTIGVDGSNRRHVHGGRYVSFEKRLR